MVIYEKPKGQTFDHAFLLSDTGCVVAELMFTCNGSAPWHLTLKFDHDTPVGRRTERVVVEQTQYPRRSRKALKAAAEKYLTCTFVNNVSVKTIRSINHLLSEGWEYDPINKMFYNGTRVILY